MLLIAFIHIGELFYPFHSIMNYKRMFDVILMQHNGTKECFMSPNCSTVFSIIAQQGIKMHSLKEV